MRRRAAVDDNQSEIVAALRAVGGSVVDLSSVGAGCPDVLCGYRGVNYAVEIKDGAKVKSQRKLTPAQVEFHAAWRGQICVVETVDEALRAIGAVK